VKIETTRFGEIDIKESELIVMRGPIFGFERFSRFVLLFQNKNTPLWWLQSLEDPSIAFVVVNPRIVKSDYNPTIFTEDLESLDINSSDHIALLAIVTVRSQPLRVTANLRAPILINAETRMARQVVLEDADYSIQYDVLDHKADVNKDLSETGGVWTDWTKRPSPQAVMI
jgi:flagellar assembly factor FliW